MEDGQRLGGAEPVVGRELGVTHVVAGDAADPHSGAADAGCEAVGVAAVLHRPVRDGAGHVPRVGRAPEHARAQRRVGVGDQMPCAVRFEEGARVLGAVPACWPRRHVPHEPDTPTRVLAARRARVAPDIACWVGELGGRRRAGVVLPHVGRGDDRAVLAVAQLKPVEVSAEGVPPGPPCGSGAGGAEGDRGIPRVQGVVGHIVGGHGVELAPRPVEGVSAIPPVDVGVGGRHGVDDEAQRLPASEPEVGAVDVGAVQVGVVAVR